MGKTPKIPSEFKLRPFTLDEARKAGISRHSLRRKTWQRIGARLYRWAELADDPWLTLSAWQQVLPPETVFGGASAAWLLGLDLRPTEPVEVVVPMSSGIRTRPGLLVRHSDLPRAELVTTRGLRATALHLTIAGLCLQRPAVEALVAIDMAVRLRLTDPAALAAYAEASKARRGASRMKSLVSFAAPAESPMETRLRWLLIQAGLPRPELQVKLREGAARFAGRVDLYYPQARLVLEYDGGNHRDRLVEDDRRQNVLASAGYQLLRFTAADVYTSPEVTVAQVRAALEGRRGRRG